MMTTRTRSTALLLSLGLLGGTAAAEDWPAFRHDSRRSGVTAESLEATRLAEAWCHAAPVPPQPAWGGAAKWDAYHGKATLADMRDYDLVFQPVVAGRSLYFGSSADDAVHCLDTATGRRRWVFTTGGPVRIAPAVADGRVYFGSDDGAAYCVSERGALVWKYSPAPTHRLLISNGRPISFWPVRTGVTVRDGSAYFAASLFPWKASYFCAVDARTGKPEGSGHYVREYEAQRAMTFEGALAVDDERVYTPQGRVWLTAIQRGSGLLATNARVAGGGSFLTVTEDGYVAGGGPSRHQAVQIANVRAPAGAPVPHWDARSLAVAGSRAYLLFDNALAGLEWPSGKELWRVACGPNWTHIVAGDWIFIGGKDRVRAHRAADGTEGWASPVRGDAHGLAVADGALFVSTHEGRIYCFRPGRTAVAAAAVPAPPAQAAPAPTGGVALAAGPLVRFTAPDSAEAWWQTREPVPTRLEYGEAGTGAQAVVEDAALRTEHRAVLRGLRPGRQYDYRVEAGTAAAPRATRLYTLDAFFNNTLPVLAPTNGPYGDDPLTADFAAAALESSGIRQGICLVYGGGEGRLGYAIAARSRLRVICLETDPAQVERGRARLQQSGAYGQRVSLVAVPSLERVPLAAGVANLIVSESALVNRRCPGRAREVFRLLKPGGGVACIGRPVGALAPPAEPALTEWLKTLPEEAVVEVTARGGGRWARITRPALPGSGVWSHQYGTPENRAFGGETLAGASRTDDLEVQWVGRPGPRYQADRQVRKPSPLAVNGRLFMQGLDRFIAADCYNGEVLWVADLPDSARFNIPRDASNYCADDEYLYIAAGDRCLKLAADSGAPKSVFAARRGAGRTGETGWSYIAVHGGILIGSATRAGSAFSAYWGGGNWFDGQGGWDTAKVCSDTLFGLDKASGAVLWTRDQGIVINTTLTIGGGRLCFVECRNPTIRQAGGRIVGEPELWQDQFLVALDPATGAMIWEQALAQPWPGKVMYSLASAEGKLVLCSSGDKMYHVSAFSLADGGTAWKAELPWASNNHGGHMSRPAIAGSRVYVRPASFDLQSGERLKDFPGGGCGSYACSTEALFYRAGNVTMYAPADATVSSWARLRPDCWLSTIPAQGLVLSPEGGGGCWCSIWLETSIAFKPLKSGEVF